MTRDEFIDDYLERSGWSQYRTPMGWRLPGRCQWIALPCNCGHSICDGWAAIPDDDLDSVEDHFAKCADDPRMQAAIDEYREHKKQTGAG